MSNLPQVVPDQKFELGKQHKTPAGWGILGWSLTGTAVASLTTGNVLCFGTNLCSNGTSIAVGVGDAVVGVAVVAFITWFIVAVARAADDD